MVLFLLIDKNPGDFKEICREIASECHDLQLAPTRGELGMKIARLVLRHSPADIQQMKRNFGKKIEELSAEYRDRLTQKINEHLLGTYQTIRLRHQQGSFGAMKEPVTHRQKSYWDMVISQCTPAGDSNPRIRFLNYLLAAFSMFVLDEPGHPVGMPFPGGFKVEQRGKDYYCLIRDKEKDVFYSICNFCPAKQTEEPGAGK
jgi:uncharacterized protein (UPF0305 family)